MVPDIYKLTDHYRGDDFDGYRFTVVDTITLIPVDFTDTSLKCEFRRGKPTGPIQKTVIDGDGLTIEDAVNGVIVLNGFNNNWPAANYFFDIQTTFLNGVVKTYIRGTQLVIEDTTK